MVRLKRIAVLASVACMFVFGCLMLTACGGDQIAATWAHGEVKEDDVTNAVTNMQKSYGLTDATSWQSFIENKYYDSDALKSSSNSSKNSKKSGEASSSSSSADSSASSSDSSENSKGTVNDLRTYVINQLVRQQVIDWQVQQENIQVSDEEVEAYVDTYRKQVEKQYMEGVFESYLENTQGITLDEFKDQARKSLAEQKLQQQATGSTTDTDAWNKYVDGLVSQADVKINDAPANLPYDPANMSSSSSSSEDSTAGESTDTASESTDTASESSDGSSGVTTETTSTEASADAASDSSSSN